MLGTPETIPPRNWQGDRENPATFERFTVDDDITLWISHEVLNSLAPGTTELVFAFSDYGRFRASLHQPATSNQQPTTSNQ